MRYAHDVTTVTSALSTSVADGRPAMVMGAVEGLRVFGAHTAGGGEGCQLALRNVSGNWEGNRLRSCVWQPSN